LLLIAVNIGTSLLSYSIEREDPLYVANVKNDVMDVKIGMVNEFTDHANFYVQAKRR